MTTADQMTRLMMIERLGSHPGGEPTPEQGAEEGRELDDQDHDREGVQVQFQPTANQWGGRKGG